jgi:ribA/ribD-fused uncharacterized protein
MNKVLGFNKEYRFLSNFWPATVELDGEEYNSTEHAYQAAKTVDLDQRKKIREATKSGDAKRLGQMATVRPDWEQVKIGIMKDLVLQKFTKHEELKEKLLATGDAYLEETNSWSDIFWGVCHGIGKNHLGKILMEVRDEIKSAASPE